MNEKYNDPNKFFQLSKAEQREVKRFIDEYTTPFKELMSYYKCAMMEVETKFRVMSEDLSLEYDRNPIETIKSRLKSMDSIIDKLVRNGLNVTAENIEKHLSDVAGVRIICGFPSDIYAMSSAFAKQDDINVIEIKDYIKDPKPNGYRSLHMIVEIPIFLHDEKKMMKVEVQFRTISMDWWASLEHKIRYKKDVVISEITANELIACANIASMLDEKMESIGKVIQGK